MIEDKDIVRGVKEAVDALNQAIAVAQNAGLTVNVEQEACTKRYAVDSSQIVIGTRFRATVSKQL